MSKSPTLFSSDDEDEGPQLEEKLLKKFHSMLQGVPPPSTITMSNLTASEMLEKYKENIHNYGVHEIVLKKCSRKKDKTPLVYYNNSSKTSEDIAILSQKLLSRYVYSETMSSCNVWFDSSITSGSASKSFSKQNRLGFSPGNRLSHLARRRQMFSSENLHKLVTSDRRHQIEIEKPKSNKKNLINSYIVEFEKRKSLKRALFLSPDNEEKKPRTLCVSSQQNIDANKAAVDSNKIWLSQQDIYSSSFKKRKRHDFRDKNSSWPRRALTFTDKELSENQDINSENSKVISEIQLSLHHKTKLLWAVSVALKERNINSNDPMFKSCASALFMVCRKHLGKILNSNIEGGTSDKILYFARDHVDTIIKKLNCSKKSEHQKADVKESVKKISILDNYSETSSEYSNNNETFEVSDSQVFNCSYDSGTSSLTTSTIEDNYMANGEGSVEIRNNIGLVS